MSSAFGGLLRASTLGAAMTVTGLFSPVALAAQSLPEIEVPVPVVLRLPASTVALALGNVAIVSRDADVLFYNPGMLSQAEGVAASAQRFGSAATAGSFANVQSLGGYAVGLGARFVDWSSAEIFYADAVGSGSGVLSQRGTSRASSLALTGGVGRSIGPVRLGVSATYLREQFRSVVGESALFDVGAAMSIGPGFAGLTVQQIGEPVSLLNPTPTSLYATSIAPWRATLGYGTRPLPVATFVDLAGVWQVTVDSQGDLRPAGGVELSYVPVEGFSLTARMGGRRTLDRGESAVTGGVGVSLDRVSLDYALDPSREGPAAHRIGIRVR